jgi:hypothetical protein
MVGATAPSLVSRGLTPDADLVYRTLLSYGGSTAADLAQALGMTRRRVDTALVDLLDARAVVHYGSHPSWRAEPVDQVVQRLRHRQVRRAAAPVPVPKLPAAEETVELGPGIRHLRSRELTRLRLASLVQQSR